MPRSPGKPVPPGTVPWPDTAVPVVRWRGLFRRGPVRLIPGTVALPAQRRPDGKPAGPGWSCRPPTSARRVGAGAPAAPFWPLPAIVRHWPEDCPIGRSKTVGSPEDLIRIPSISVTSRRTLDVPPIPGTRTGSCSFHSERFRKSYGIFRNRYHRECRVSRGRVDTRPAAGERGRLARLSCPVEFKGMFQAQRGRQGGPDHMRGDDLPPVHGTQHEDGDPRPPLAEHRPLSGPTAVQDCSASSATVSSLTRWLAANSTNLGSTRRLSSTLS